MKSSNFLRLVTKAKKIAVVSHKRPDGDAVSSLMALVLGLQKINKEVIAFTKGDLLSQFPFLPGVLFAQSELEPGSFDLIIFLDHNVLERGEFETELIGSTTPFFIIDHHPAPPSLEAKRAYIDTGASSTTEVLYDILTDLGIGIDKQLATCLLTGLITDTNSFQNQNTTDKTLEIAATLLKSGANHQKITSKTSNSRPVKNWKILGRALRNLSSIDKYGLYYTYLTQEDLVSCEASKEDISGIANFLILSAKEARVILTLVEEDPGKFKASLRTRDPEINLTKVAALFGGGGHPGASGFVFEGRLKPTDRGGLRVLIS